MVYSNQMDNQEQIPQQSSQSVQQEAPVPANTSSSFLKTLSIGLGVVGIGIAIGIGGYFLGAKKTQTLVQNQQAILTPPAIGGSSSRSPYGLNGKDAVSAATANWKTYANQQLGISFKYPTEWIDLQEKKELCLGDNGSIMQNDGQPCIHISIFTPTISNVSDKPFLAAQSSLFTKYIPGRGAYWGDRFTISAKNKGTTAEEFINNYCTENKSYRCSKQVNTDGIVYIKSLEDEQVMESERQAIYYALLSRNKDFPVILLSNQGFLDTLTMEDSEEIFDKILSTFRFTN